MKHSNKGNDAMRLQDQTANGSWVDCSDRTEYYLEGCEEFGKMDREGVLAALAAGKKVRNDASDWYSVCRDGDVCDIPVETVSVEMKKCSCGHTVAASLAMSTSTGSSCSACYDRMSC